MFVYPLISSTLDESSNETIPKLTTFMLDKIVLACYFVQFITHSNPNIMTKKKLVYYFSNIPFLIILSQLFTLNENNSWSKISCCQVWLCEFPHFICFPTSSTQLVSHIVTFKYLLFSFLVLISTFHFGCHNFFLALFVFPWALWLKLFLGTSYFITLKFANSYFLFTILVHVVI
jgi:hypothetical protein